MHRVPADTPRSDKQPLSVVSSGGCPKHNHLCGRERLLNTAYLEIGNPTIGACIEIRCMLVCIIANDTQMIGIHDMILHRDGRERAVRLRR